MQEPDDTKCDEKLSAHEAASTQLAPHSGWTKIFKGSHGLRLIWSLLGFLLLAVLLAQMAKPVLRLFFPPASEMMRGKSDQPVSVTLISEWVTFWVLSVAAWIMSKIEGRPASSYGLGIRETNAFKNVLAGGLWGFSLLSLLTAVLWALGLLVMEHPRYTGATTLLWGTLWLIAFLGVACAEEFMTRGYLQYVFSLAIQGVLERLGADVRKARRLGFWFAACLGAFLFGAAHSKNAGESPLGLISAGCIGLVLAYSLWRSGTLWWAIGFHAMWDWGESFLWGVPNSGSLMEHRLLQAHAYGPAWMSGGSTGPEGSILVFPVIVGTAFAIAGTLNRSKSYFQRQFGANQ